jgi:hypothetical protein
MGLAIKRATVVQKTAKTGTGRVRYTSDSEPEKYDGANEQKGIEAEASVHEL